MSGRDVASDGIELSNAIVRSGIGDCGSFSLEVQRYSSTADVRDKYLNCQVLVLHHL